MTKQTKRGIREEEMGKAAEVLRRDPEREVVGPEPHRGHVIRALDDGRTAEDWLSRTHVLDCYVKRGCSAILAEILTDRTVRKGE